MILFSRDQLERGLGLLVARLAENKTSAGVRIVGGAAISLRYFDREVTSDIDGRSIGDGAGLERAVLEVAHEMGWQPDWLNTSASQFIPSYGSAVQWEVLYSRAGVTIEVASAEALLVMKLRANRPGRDELDIATLLAIVGLRDLETIDRLYESYYPGDSLSDRAVRMVATILSIGLPPIPPPRPAPIIEPTRDNAPKPDGNARNQAPKE